MNRFRLDDELFSPVRLDATVSENSDSAEESQNDHSNAGEFSLTNSVKNTVTLEKSVIKFAQENELKYQEESTSANTCSSNFNKSSSDKSESLSIDTPILIQKSSDSLHTKKHSSKVKLAKNKDHKGATPRKENAESQQKKQKIYMENILDSNTVKSDPSDKLHQKKPRPTSLLLNTESTKQDSSRDIKKKLKITKQSLKDSYGDGVQKSIFKSPTEKKSTSCSSNSLEKSKIKFEDLSVVSTKSRGSKESTSSNILESEKCSSVTEEVEELNVNPPLLSYEDTIKKMIHRTIDAEWTKIRQLMYMQQMHFYREINKIKAQKHLLPRCCASAFIEVAGVFEPDKERDEIGRQHLATTERLFKVIEKLMQMNVALKALSNK